MDNPCRVKVILSGEYIELYEYQKPCIPTRKDPEKQKGKGNSKDKEDRSKEHRDRALRRAQTQVRRLICSNTGQYLKPNGEPFPPVFLTLTFKDNVTDIKYANNEFKKFMKRLKYNAQLEDVKYLAVIEFQKRGAIHYHVICFNLPFLPPEMLKSTWGHGWIDIHAVKKIRNIGAYVAKYMTADSNDTRLVGEKTYFCSKNLIKPVELSDIEDITELLSHPEAEYIYNRVFENEFIGSVHYKQLRIKRNETDKPTPSE